MSTQITQKLNFITPIVFPIDYLEKQPLLIKALIMIGSAADSYIYLGKHCIQASTLEKSTQDVPIWKTALKIMSYVLTAFLLPGLALIAKIVYKNWAEKNIPIELSKSSNPPELKKAEKPPQNENKEFKNETISSNNENQKLFELNQDFLKKQQLRRNQTEGNEEYFSAYNGLKGIAEIIQKLDTDSKLKLSFKGKDLSTSNRKRLKNPNGYGKSEASVKALEEIISSVRKALELEITEVEVNGKMLSLYDVLKKVEKSQSQFVLQKNSAVSESFTQLYNDVLEKVTKNLTSWEENLKNCSLPGKEEDKERLSQIRLALPISNDLLEVCLSKSIEKLEDKDKAEFKKKFLILTHTTLIKGFPFLKMTPKSLVEDMTALMSHEETPLQVKCNLLDLFESLLHSPYYQIEAQSADFKEAISHFSDVIKNSKGNELETLTQKENHDVLALYSTLYPANDQAIQPEKMSPPDFHTILDTQKIEVIKKIILDGKEKEMKKLAKNLAVKLPAFYAAFLQDISYQDFLSDPQKIIKPLAEASDHILLPLQELKNSLYKKDDDDKFIKKMKEAYKQFIGFIVKKSFNLKDYITTSCLSSKIDHLKEITDIFLPDDNFKAYRKYERDVMQDTNAAFIPIISLLLKDITFTTEKEASLYTMERINLLNSLYHRFQEYQRHASFYRIDVR